MNKWRVAVIVLLYALMVFIGLSCSFSTLKNFNPDMGEQYHAVKAEINHLESVCMSEHTWGLVNRGKRMLHIDAQKLCDEETKMRWRYYYWADCWNTHEADERLDRCEQRPLLPGEEEE